MKELQRFDIYDKTLRIGRVVEHHDRRRWRALRPDDSLIGLHSTQRAAADAVKDDYDEVAAERLRLARAM